MITKLNHNEVFVFGSNAQGFHGAGAAGYAFCGHTRNDWRTCPAKQAAIAAHGRLGNTLLPEDEPDPRVGRWCIWGRPRGFQCGTDGFGFGIVTVYSPGGQRLPPDEILTQFQDMLKFAKAFPIYQFLMTEVGCGFGGHDKKVMRDRLEYAIDIVGLPSNFKNYETVYL